MEENMVIAPNEEIGVEELEENLTGEAEQQQEEENERAGGMRVFIQRRRGGASADGGLPPAGRTGDCAGHMGMGESAGGKAGGAPGGGARQRGGSGDMNVKRLVNL